MVRDGVKTLERLSRWARGRKQEAHALLLAYRDPRTPWYAKLAALLVVLYALSPIDLIPDFIPVLGYLDDLILIPLGVAIACRLIPREVMDSCRRRAAAHSAAQEPRDRLARVGAVAVAAVWLAITALVVRFLLVPLLRRRG